MKKLYLIKMQSDENPRMFYKEYVIAESLVVARQVVQEKCPNYSFCWFADFHLPEDLQKDVVDFFYPDGFPEHLR